MKTHRWLLLSISLVMSSGLFIAQDALAQSLSQPRQAELTKLVRQDCGSCHGMTLKGGLGKGLLPSDLEETSVSHLTEVILDGVYGTPMPGWRGLLSTQEAEWIARHLKAGSIKRGNQ